MSREVSSDFSTLVDFINGYNLRAHSENREFIKVLSQQHKKFHSYLTCIAELQHLYSDASLTPTISETQLRFLAESCSDIGSALFVMTHGAYKASKMMLRSSIETFNKGFNIDSIPDLDQEKSVFLIFDKIKSLHFFSQEPQKKLLSDIHQVYASLCQDTHTATEINMQQITALNYFPAFNLNDANQVSKYLMSLVSIYNTLICIKYNDYFQKMHYRNREIVLKTVPKIFRPLVYGIS